MLSGGYHNNTKGFDITVGYLGHPEYPQFRGNQGFHVSSYDLHFEPFFEWGYCDRGWQSDGLQWMFAQVCPNFSGRTKTIHEPTFCIHYPSMDFLLRHSLLYFLRGFAILRVSCEVNWNLETFLTCRSGTKVSQTVFKLRSSRSKAHCLNSVCITQNSGSNPSLKN